MEIICIRSNRSVQEINEGRFVSFLRLDLHVHRALALFSLFGHSVYVSGPRAAYPIFRDHGLRIIAAAWRVVCGSMQQRSVSFKLVFEESHLLVVGNQLLVVCRVIPAQPKQRKGHSM